MKLMNLNASIDAAPKVFAATVFGKIAFEKGSLKAALKGHFGGQRTAETGWRLDSENCLRPEPAFD